jgi:hypothetical protein
VTPDPDQLLLTGRRYADVEAERKAAEAERRRNERASKAGAKRRAKEAEIEGWLVALTGPMTIADLAAAWWPRLGRPRDWRPGFYPRDRLRIARLRVRSLLWRGWVTVEAGPLGYRSGTGWVVRKVAG